MSAGSGKRLMSIYLEEILGQRNFDRISEIAAPGMVDHMQPGLSGPDALDAHARRFCANTPDVEIEVLTHLRFSGHQVKRTALVVRTPLD